MPIVQIEAERLDHRGSLASYQQQPFDEELYLLPQAISSPINTSPITPSSHNRFDILSSISIFCVRFARARLETRRTGLITLKMREISTHLCIRNAREEQTPTKMDWNPGTSAELPVSPAGQYTGSHDSTCEFKTQAFRVADTGALCSGVIFRPWISGSVISTTRPPPSRLYARTLPP